MKVLLINTSERTGGAAIAAHRLLAALRQQGVDAKMMVARKETDQETVVQAAANWRYKAAFLLDRLRVFFHNGLSKRGLWDIDSAEVGLDITETQAYREADVIHLHWVNQGFLSLATLEKIVHSGKRVVWTMHDMWPFTGICHYSNDCLGYRKHCGRCPQLRYGGIGDASNRVLCQKSRLLKRSHVSFVACSHWLEQLAEDSTLLRQQRVTCISNALPTDIFHPDARVEARKRLGLPLKMKFVLFASMKVTDKRKGVDYLLEAARLMEERYADQCQDMAFLVMGQHAEELRQRLQFPVYAMGYVSDAERVADIYRAADVFVTPSLQDNLPNTIAEAMGCGTPCVGFRTGGIPEMIDHEANGYVAQLGDSEDLARGILYVLEHPLLGEAAQHYALYQYDPARVAAQYIAEYRCEE